MSPEVLIYIQNIKTYFEKNQDTKNYFIGSGDENLFYDRLIEISQKKFDSEGEVMLTKLEFENLRSEFNTKKIPNNAIDIFMTVGDFGEICLN